MIVFPNAKINLGLRVHRKREDGFHEIESCFLPVPWTDVLEVIESEEEKFTFSGLPIPGSYEDNLVWKAYELLKKEFSIPSVLIHLHKDIPMGGGTGGGSSDGAFMLKALNELFQLGIPIADLEEYASGLGSDCPFFIRNRPAVATGRGTDLQEISLDLKGMHILMINPGIHISTQEAYSNIQIGTVQEGNVGAFLSDPMENWKDTLVNDFEGYAFSAYPEIGRIKEKLYHHGAVFASMTGSGATVFGIFDQSPNALEFPDSYASWSGEF